MLELIDRHIERVADHLQAETGQVLQLQHHRLGRAVGTGQGAVVQVTGAGRLSRRRGHLGDQHPGFFALG
ncbi:hypothetical protein D3C80_1563620 [compost metagenome]